MLYKSETIACIPALPRRLGRRLAWTLLSAAFLALLALAAWVQPQSEGLGSHQQMGLPPCGFLERTGYPCPTCGMTTAFALAIRGRLLQAFVTQPAGALAALFCLLAAVASLYAAFTARRFPHGLAAFFARHYALLLLLLIVLLALAWLWCCLRVGVF